MILVPLVRVVGIIIVEHIVLLAAEIVAMLSVDHLLHLVVAHVVQQVALLLAMEVVTTYVMVVPMVVTTVVLAVYRPVVQVVQAIVRAIVTAAINPALRDVQPVAKLIVKALVLVVQMLVGATARVVAEDVKVHVVVSAMVLANQHVVQVVMLRVDHRVGIVKSKEILMNYENALDTYKERYDLHNAAISRNITFQVTERCNLACTYCYQIHKTPKVMSWEVAKACVDSLFTMYHENTSTFINENTEFLVLDFIGGEPLLEAALIEKILTYFMDKALIENPTWAKTWKASMSSNGVLYDTPEVKHLFNKFDSRISFNVSIDGEKEMHDKCRVFPDGSGSFDIAHAAQRAYDSTHPNSTSTKVTISPENMALLSQTIKYYIKEGYTYIHANTIYEPDWTSKDAQLFYKKLCEIADILLSLDNFIDITLFEPTFFRPKQDKEQTWCGGYDSMLAFDTEGNMYPCVRYMESSLGTDAPPVIIGDAWHGLYYTKEQQEIHKCLACTTWWSQNDDECHNCPIAEGCADCAAEGYQHFGQFNKRHKLGSCWVHRARSLANVYYWNKVARRIGSNVRMPRNLPDDIALQIISKEELEKLDKLTMVEE